MVGLACLGSRVRQWSQAELEMDNWIMDPLLSEGRRWTFTSLGTHLVSLV